MTSSKLSIAAVGSLILISSGLAAQAADSVNLQPQSPQIDTAAPGAAGASPGAAGVSPDASTALPGENPAISAPTSPKVHKLGASRQALRDDVDLDNAAAGVDAAQPRTPRIYINTFTMKATTSSSGITDPFNLMKALLGARGKDYAKLYAERDTGYGVCGFLMNVPIGKRGFVVVLKCFPSMPAAEAGMKPGDKIISVNGQSTLDIPAKEIWDYFTGMPGTEVNIELLRRGEPISVTLRRMDIGRIPDLSTRAEFLTLFEHNGMSRFVQR